MSSQASMRTGTSASSTHRRVLVVEPNTRLSDATERWLIENGLSATIANSVDAALEAISVLTYSHAVTELKFSAGTGFEVLQALAKHQPQCRAIVLSSHCNPAVAVRAVKAGAQDVVAKPIHLEFLIGILLQHDMSRASGALSLPTPNSIRDEHIREVFLSTGSNVVRAANCLSMHRRTLERIIKRLPDLRSRGLC